MRRTLESIYRCHRQGLYTLALSITRQDGRAEDAVQEAFARLWRSSRRPQGDPVAYVFAAVRNAALDQAARSDLSVGLPASIFDGQAADPAKHAVEAESQRRLREAIDDLPDPQRQVVVLKAYAGLTFEQIAEVCGQPLSTVASRYRRVLEKLKQQLEPST